MNPALQAEFEKSAHVFPILRLDLEARGLDLGTQYIAPGGIVLPEVAVQSKAAAGGWGPIRIGPGTRGSSLASTRTSVLVEDVSKDLVQLLEQNNPRGSAVSISWATIGLVQADWEPIFTGVLEDWQTRGAGSVELVLRTDEAPLRSPAPKPTITRAAWPTAADSSIFGTTHPLLLGVHDSFRITTRGQVRAFNLRIDRTAATTLQLFSASLGNLETIHRVYFDGLLQTGLAFQTLRGQFGGVYQTILAIERDDAPADEVVVSFDATGPDTTGGTGGTTLVNPVSQLKVFLEEYAFRQNNDGIYAGAHPRIHQPSWTATEAFFQLRDPDSGVFLGGAGSRPIGLDIVEGFLAANPFVRMWWNELGQIECHVIPFNDDDPAASAWLPADREAEPGTFVYSPGDRRDIFNRVEMNYLFSDLEGKFLAEHEAHEVTSIEDPRSLLVSNQWSQARYDRST